MRYLLCLLASVYLMGCVESGELGVEGSEEIELNATEVLGFVAENDDTKAKQLMSLHNEARASRGLKPLKWYWDLEDDAYSHTTKMVRDGRIYHSSNLGEITASGYWLRMGENVGVGPSIASLHSAFMNSAGHRDNILGDFTHVGIGVKQSGSRLFTTVVFMKAKVAKLEQTFPPFRDDDFNAHERNIYKIYEAEVTKGCSKGTKYCPSNDVTRGEMAIFLTRALNLPSTSRDYFTDDTGKNYERSANSLAAAGITTGCGNGKFCGGDPITRGQMAVFLSKGFELPATTTDYFSDDNGRFYEPHVNRVAKAGITTGCGGEKYCGEARVKRDQMASFLARALRL